MNGDFCDMDKYILSEADILSKLALIERHLNGFTGAFYEVSEDFKSYDVMSIHSEASKMMKFVGLNTYVPYVAFVKTSENVGGNVELDDSEDVFIEVSEECKYNKKKVLAIMAHEICHKVLYVNGLYFPYNKIENELLTDLATVYVGFGKLSLNGCYEETETSTSTIGYLSLKQFAMAYNIVCAAYGIHSAEKELGLGEFALEEVGKRTVFVRSDVTIDDIRWKLRFAQEAGSVVMRDVILLENVLSGLKTELKNRHQQYRNDFVVPFISSSDKINNQISANELYAKYGVETKMQKMAALMDGFLKDLRQYQEIDESVLLDVECPVCGYKKRKGLKENKQAFIQCPNCKYTFVWDGQGIEKTGSCKENSSLPKGKSIVGRIKRIFSKIKKSLR